MISKLSSFYSLNAEQMALFYRGLSGFSTDRSFIYEQLKTYIADHAVFAGPQSFCILYLPDKNELQQVVQVLHIHSEGGRKETNALVGAVLNFVKEQGYNTLRAVNGSGRRDDVWARAFRHKDWTQKPVKTVFDFEVKK